MKLARLLIVTLLTFAMVVSVPVAVAATGGPATRLPQETAATAGAQDPAPTEGSLSLDRPAQRLIQQELRNQGFDPGTPDGLFGPRTRSAIRDWQLSRGAPPTGYLNGAEAELLRTAATPPPVLSEAGLPPEPSAAADSRASPAAAPPASAPAAASNLTPTSVAAEVAPRNATPTNTEPTTRAASSTRNAQLPPEIMVDRHLLRAQRFLADDPAAALEAMNEILALQDNHDLVLEDDFHFHHAQVAFAAGRTVRAIASLNEYLLAAGRSGEFYRQALELLDSADVRLQEEERVARWSPGMVFRDCEVCPEMVVLPGSVLALARYEVTVGDYRAFASATGGGAGGGCQAHTYVTPESWQDPGHPQTDRHPAACLSWNDAQEYVSWLSREAGASYRLPTEAEWGQAAAASRPGCYLDRTGTAGTCPVGSFGLNANGFSDLVSNLAEWTSDCWEGDCTRRVIRGGAWAADARFQRSAERTGVSTRLRWAFIGFRVARTLE